MGEVVDCLYDNNLGSDAIGNVFDIASDLLKFEQRFLDWQRSLPTGLSLLQPDHLRSETGDPQTLRLSFVLTTRFLNLRVLTHRPILCKYLDILGKARPDFQQLIMLRQVSANSIRICSQSASDMIKMMREVLSPPNPLRHLLGAWWFALYYSGSTQMRRTQLFVSGN